MSTLDQLADNATPVTQVEGVGKPNPVKVSELSPSTETYTYQTAPEVQQQPPQNFGLYDVLGAGLIVGFILVILKK